MARKKAEFSGSEKVAILMMAMGEQLASKVLSKLDEKEIHQVVNSMSFMENITPTQIEKISGDFFTSLEGGAGGLPAGGKSYLKNMLERTMEPDKAEEILNRITAPGSPEELTGGLDAVRRLDPKTMVGFLNHEHPQTVAIIMAHLDSAHAAEVLKLLPERFQSEVMFRMATLERISPSVLQDLDQALATEFHETGAIEGSALGGVETVSEIVNALDHNLEVSILSEIEGLNPELADSIRNLMFVFEDIVNIDDRGMQAILKEVSNEDLMLSLKTASDELKEKIFGNMSKRAAEMMRDDLQSMGPAKLSDVEKAQQSIIRTVKRLEEEGKVTLAAGGEELV
ncbi:MAG: flagellar motor switch protein FliG [bacterium]|nr:MAG: flagellar motor switch protein FliG [bacterium]